MLRSLRQNFSKHNWFKQQLHRNTDGFPGECGNRHWLCALTLEVSSNFHTTSHQSDLHYLREIVHSLENGLDSPKRCRILSPELRSLSLLTVKRSFGFVRKTRFEGTRSFSRHIITCKPELSQATDVDQGVSTTIRTRCLHF